MPTRQPPLLRSGIRGGPHPGEVLDNAAAAAPGGSRWSRALARAVHYAHQQGIVHRDLKPANVLLAVGQAAGLPSEGRPAACPTPKITDFGLAKTLDETGQTQSGAILGTPSYMAPEQAAGNSRQVGPCGRHVRSRCAPLRSLTGRPPFHGATSSYTLDQVRCQEPVPPSRSQPEVPADLEAICLRPVCKKSRTQASPGAAALAEDLPALSRRPDAGRRPPRRQFRTDSGARLRRRRGTRAGGVWVILRGPRGAAAAWSLSSASARQSAGGQALTSCGDGQGRPPPPASPHRGHSRRRRWRAGRGVPGAGVHRGRRPAPKTIGQTLPPNEAASLVETLARTVHYAHETGLVHCHLQRPTY